MTTPSPITLTEYAGPQLFSRAALVAAGLSEYRLRCALVDGRLVVVSPGVYARDEFRVTDRVTAHRAAVHALLGVRVGPAVSAGSAVSAGGTVVSHLSAAMLHGLPLPCEVPTAVHVTRAPPAKSRAGVRLTVHRRSVLAGESVEIAGLAVTSMPRTVVDCLLVLPPAEGMALVEAALGSGRVDQRDLDDQLRRHPRVPGMRAAAAACCAVTGSAVSGSAVTGSAVMGRR